MIQENKRSQEALTIDIAYLIRCLLKNAFVIFTLACTIGIGAYVLLDSALEDSFTSSITLSVIPRDNSANRVSDGSITAAVNRCVSVLNSDVLQDQIRKDEAVKKISGSVTAAAVEGTNLIKLSAHSGSAEKAFRLLKSALNSYPSLSSYYEAGYILKTLNGLDADHIMRDSARPFYYGIIAAVLIFLAGVGLTVCMCLFTDRIHNEEQAAQMLDVRLLGTLPFIKKKRRQKAILISSPDTDISYIEEYNKLAVRIQERMDANSYKILLVTSVSENEGKSTVAANLVLELAKRGKRVMLIDADMRRAAQAKIFDKDVPEGKEFSDYLEEKCTFSDVLLKFKDMKGILCMWQKHGVASPDKLLESEKLKKTLGICKKHVDYVVIDTPPMGIVRDAEVLAECGEAVLITLREDDACAAVVNDVVDALEDAGSSVIGGVLNMAKSRKIFGGKKNHYGRK